MSRNTVLERPPGGDDPAFVRGLDEKKANVLPPPGSYLARDEEDCVEFCR